jgi:hypothetical protein
MKQANSKFSSYKHIRLNITLVLVLVATVLFFPINAFAQEGNPEECFTLELVVAEGEGTLEAMTPQNCEGGYLTDTQVELLATPGEGSQVESWDGTDDDELVDDINSKTISSQETIRVYFASINTLNEDSVLASSLSNEGVSVNITSDNTEFSATEDVVLQVTLTNPNDYPIKILSWFTLIEGITDPMFVVSQDGESSFYYGPLISRRPPIEEDYITLLAKEAITSEVILSSIYGFPVSGNYSVVYDGYSPELYYGELDNSGSLTSNTLNLIVEGREFQFKEEVTPPDLEAAGSNTFKNGCTSSEQTYLIFARDNASDLAFLGMNYLTGGLTGSRYTTWFGSYTSSRYNTVKGYVSDIQSVVDNATLEFDCSNDDCASNTIAWVYGYDPYEINICNAFYGQPVLGYQGQAGTILHEISHFWGVGSTFGTDDDDNVYGQTAAKNRATNRPDDAIHTASNYEFFFENTPALECPYIAVPSITSPAHNAFTNDNTPYIDWTSVSNSGGYDFNLKNSAYTNIVEVSTVNSNFTSNSLSDGTYYWKVRSYGALGCFPGEWSTQWAFTVDTSAPSIPSLTSPSNGSTTSDRTPTFDWSASSGSPTQYQLLVDDSSSFSSPVVNQTVNSPQTQYTPTSNLAYDAYYWKVRAKDEAGNWSNYSSYRTVTVELTCNTPSTPSLTAPSNGLTTPDNTPYFDWNTASNSSQYQFQLDDYSSFSSPIISATTGNSYMTTSSLSDDTYYWRVRGHNNSGGCNVYGSWSSYRTVTVDTTGPSAPSLISPSNGSSTTDTTPAFDWNNSTGATEYQLQVDNNSSFSSPAIDVTPTSSAYTPSSALSPTLYYWRVRAKDAVSNWGSWSSARSFTIIIALPGAFNKSGPSNGATNQSINPTLSWGASSGVTTYYYCYDTTNDNACSSWSSNGSSTSKSLSGLNYSTTYYWHIRATNSGGTTYSNGNSSSAFWSFTTQSAPVTPPGAFNKSAPANGATNQSINPTLSWGASSGATTYYYCYDTTNDNACTSWTGTSSTSKALSGLSYSTTYYWHIRATNSSGTTYSNGNSSSAFWSFTTMPTGGSAELLISGVSFYPTSPYINDDITVSFDVQNTSTVDAGAFYVDVYVDDQPTGCTDWGIYYTRTSGLAASTTDQLYVVIPAGDLSSGVHQIRAYVDSGCEVTEGNENNNISGPDPITVASAPAAPAHNDFDAAIDIGTIPYNHSVSVSGATRASDDPAVPSPCNLDPGMASVWYKYTAIANTSMTLDTLGSDYDTYIAVWSGSRGSLSPVACNDDYSGLLSSVTVDLTKGTTYYFEVAEFAWGISASAASAASTEEKPGITTEGDLLDGKPASDVGALAGGTLKFNVSPPDIFYTDEFGYGTGWVDPQTPRMLADVDGDGISDAVGFSDAGAVVALGTVTAFEPGLLWEGSFGTIGGWDGSKHIRTMADVNGDNKADLVGFGDYGVLVSLSTGSGFTPLSYWSYGYGSEPAGGGWNTIDNNRVVADVNGDGKADIVGYGLYGVMVSLSNGSSFGTATYWTMGYGKLLGGWDGIQNPRMIADLNGDGCGDIVGFANYGVLVSLSNACGGGNTFGEPSYWAYGYAYLLGGWDSTKHVRTFGDVNNDGADDLVGFGDSGVLVSLSNGSSLASAATYWKMGYGYVNGGWRVDRHPRMVADVNADGMADVVGFATNGVLVSSSNGGSFP